MLRLAPCVLLLAACARGIAPGTTDDLSGLEVRLERAPSITLAFPAKVSGRSARVKLEVSQLRSTATVGCFDENPRVYGQARVRTVDGADHLWPEGDLEGLTLGDRRLPRLRVGVMEGEACAITLGNDVLGPWALELRLASRTLRFEPSRPRAFYEALPNDGEVTLLDVSREPRDDWPLVAVRVKQGDATLLAPFAIATSDATSQVSLEAAKQAGLHEGLGLFDGLPLPDGIEVPPELKSFHGVAFDTLELSPGIGVAQGSLRPVKGWGSQVALGTLGGDVWGRSDVRLDSRSGVLRLSRPAIEKRGTLERCAREGRTDESQCFELEAKPSPQGLEVTATVWRALPQGARLSLDVVLDSGERLDCRVGLTFMPQDRGASTAHRFPWPKLSESLPECARALAKAKGATLAAFEESPLGQCPGTCAFVQGPGRGQTSCECQGGAGSMEAERRLLELYKLLLDRQRRPKEPEPDEP